MIHHEPINHHGGPTPGSTGEVMTAKGDEADLFERYADRLLRATARGLARSAAADRVPTNRKEKL